MDESFKDAFALVGRALHDAYPLSAGVHLDYQTIRARLVELEAENERLRERLQFWKDASDTTNDAWQTDKDRAEKAEALLRECLTVMALHPATHHRITAHLSENGHEG